jgi:hypothetical protein
LTNRVAGQGHKPSPKPSTVSEGVAAAASLPACRECGVAVDRVVRLLPRRPTPSSSSTLIGQHPDWIELHDWLMKEP